VNSQSLTKGWNIAFEVLWAAALIGLPLTSFPPFYALTGALVTPFSALPLALLMAAWLLPYLLRGGRLPAEIRPLTAFLAAAVLINALAFFASPMLIKDKTLLSQFMRTYLTLGIGLIFFFSFAAWPRTSAQFRKTMQWITLGSLLWTAANLTHYLLQIKIDSWPMFKAYLDFRETFFTVAHPFVENQTRFYGLTYEPSWFNHQLNLLYLPLWLAAAYQRSSAFRFRLWIFSVEDLLLPLALWQFIMASPRIGLAALLLVLLVLALRVIGRLIRHLQGRMAARWGFARRRQTLTRVLLGAVMAAVLLGTAWGGGTAFFNWAVRTDWRMELIKNAPPTQAEINKLLQLDRPTFLEISRRFAFLERMVYWYDGWDIFNSHPWLGVGLGNAGFYFSENLTGAGWATTEVRDVVYRLGGMPNLKSFWVRLLAETGLLGFALFAAWYVLLWISARATQKSQDILLRTVGLAGELALIAFIVEGFSVDSLAMPYLWVMTGLICAAGMAYRGEIKRDSL